MNIDKVKIELLLAGQKITQATLARRCGVSPQNISTIVRRGTCEPRTAGKIADGLGVPVSDIISSEGA